MATPLVPTARRNPRPSWICSPTIFATTTIFPGSNSKVDMKKHKYVVTVPQPHPKAYSPDRPITDLVRNQILHLSLTERHFDKRHRTGVDVYSIQTERQASEYIHHLTKKLHPEGA